MNSARTRVVILLLVALLAAAPRALLQAADLVTARDLPDDDGTSLVVSWTGAFAAPGVVKISRATYPNPVWHQVTELDGTVGEYTDSGLSRDSTYVYSITSVNGLNAISAPAKPRVSFINRGRLNQLIMLVVFVIFVLAYIKLASSGRKFFVRRIAGLTAIEEAIGRATEMGKPVLYVPGIDDMDNIQTIASMVILNDVARIAGTYETPIIVPVCRPFVIPVAEEAVKQGFLKAGRPEFYNPNNIRYLSDEQFAFTAGISGIMMREGTAANLYMGSFFAESLILAETGFSTGAIQIAGTANVHQLPFFVAACDYTLIGEELYAVSAYLSKEPKMLGTLKASDLAKLVILVLLVVGFISQTVGLAAFAELFTPR
ncbi:MAG TPA: fibronectin type III domain-containing protein [bacterium]|nr:fibronectin type III domain-containing protein [bacterium]